MRILEKLKSLEKKKKISYLLLIVILLYGCISTLLFLTVSNSLIETILSIEMPDGYFYINFDPSDPELDMSFSITNVGYYDIDDFSLRLSMDLACFDKNNATKFYKNVFKKEQNYGCIPLRSYYYNVFSGDSTCFNKSALEDFLNNVNLNRSAYLLFDYSISGKYYFNIVPFDIEIRNVNITVF